MKQTGKSIRDVIYEPPGPRTKRIVSLFTVISILVLLWILVVVVKRFYSNGQLSSRYWAFFGRWTTWKFIGEGLLGTLKIALASGALAFGLGMLLMLGRIHKKKFISRCSMAIIEFSRGVPTLLFIYFFFLVVPQLGMKLPAFWKIAAPVAISAAGVVAEVLRSGVNAVAKGQREAALSLGMSERSTFFKIVFPQGFRFVIPALISEIIIVLKDTTFAYVVSYSDLMQNSKVLISNYDAMLSVYLVVAVIYILINYLLSKISVAVANRTGSATMVFR